MADKFGGVPVEETPSTDKFGGISLASKLPQATPTPTPVTTPPPQQDLSWFEKLFGKSTGQVGPAGSVSRAAADNQPAPVPQLSQDPVSGTVDNAKPFSIPAALAVARATPAPPTFLGAGIKAASGAAAYTGIYTALQHAAGEVPSTIDAAKDLAINESLNLVGSAFASKAKAFYKSVTRGIQYGDSALQDQLGATASQRTGSGTMRFAENTFAGPDKDQALKNSGKASKELLGQTASDMSGVAPEVITDPTARAALVQKDVVANNRKSQLISNTLGNVARMRADLHPTEVTTGFAPGDIIDPATNKPVMQPVTETVNGPVPVDNVYGWSVDTLKKFPSPDLLVSSDDKAAYALAKRIQAKTIVYDETGNAVATRPLSFGDAWDFKQEADKEYGNHHFEKLSDAFNKDIETGINTWDEGKGDPLALKGFQESKKETARRRELFGKDASLKALLNSNDDEASMQATDALIRNPQRIERYLTTQSGGGGANQRRLLQGNDLANLLDKNFNRASGVFDRDGLISSWTDPDMAASRKLIYGDEGAKNVSQVINAIRTVSDNAATVGKTATNFRVANGVISLGGALLGGATIVGGHQLAGAAIAGAYIPMKYLAKAAVGKTTAPIVAALIKGEPLGMSTQLAIRMVMNSMVGSAIHLKLADGSEKEGQITKDGNISLTGAN